MSVVSVVHCMGRQHHPHVMQPPCTSAHARGSLFQNVRFSESQLLCQYTSVLSVLAASSSRCKFSLLFQQLGGVCRIPSSKMGSWWALEPAPNPAVTNSEWDLPALSLLSIVSLSPLLQIKTSFPSCRSTYRISASCLNFIDVLYPFPVPWSSVSQLCPPLTALCLPSISN